jgi:transposase
MPLVKTTLAPRGRTPVLRHRARHRDKLSAAAALTLSPARGHVGLHCRTYPDGYVDAEAYAWFLRQCLLREVRGPLVLLHDNGQMHKGPAVRQAQRDHPRLVIEPLPPYAPELNPVEGLWNQAKDKDLANFVPDNVDVLHDAVCGSLRGARDDQHRLRSFFHATGLSWRGTTLSR